MTSASGCSRGSACTVPTDREIGALAAESAIVLDSWHLYDGAGVAIDRHRERFAASVGTVFGVAVEEAVAAYDHAVEHLPRAGSWFPAFVWTAAGLRLVSRPFLVERLRRETALDGIPLVDARKRPDIKGIDQLWQLARRREVVERGYDDRLLVTGDGRVSEAIFAAVLLVAGRELIVPDAPRLPSITLAVIGDHAAGLGLTVRERPVTLPDVTRAGTVLTLSALHGVRLVAGLGGRRCAGDASLRDALQRSLESARRPLPDGGAPCGSC